MDNLVRVLQDMYTGTHTWFDIHSYKYLDTMYEMKYGYDLILDSVNAKQERKRMKEMEKQDKKRWAEVNSFLKNASESYIK